MSMTRYVVDFYSLARWEMAFCNYFNYTGGKNCDTPTLNANALVGRGRSRRRFSVAEML